MRLNTRSSDGVLLGLASLLCATFAPLFCGPMEPWRTVCVVGIFGFLALGGMCAAFEREVRS